MAWKDVEFPWSTVVAWVVKICEITSRKRREMSVLRLGDIVAPISIDRLGLSLDRLRLADAWKIPQLRTAARTHRAGFHENGCGLIAQSALRAP